MEQNTDNPIPSPEQPAQSGFETPPPAESAGELTKEAKQWAMYCHLAGLVMLLPVVPFPIGNVLGPLIIWLIKKDEYPSVKENGKEALNFQISMSIYALICLPFICLVVGAVLMSAIAITDLVFVIIVSIAVSEGKPYRYPLTIRFIK